MGTNTIISGMFTQMADALQSLGENHFKILAYRKAAKVLADYPVDVAEAYRKGGIKALTAIPSIGAALGGKIAEFIATGHMKKYDEVMAQRPKKAKKHKGFTLTELLIVLLIMAILAAIAIPHYTAFMNKIREMCGW